MAGAKVPAPLDPMVNGDDWTNILARLERTYKGYDGVSLTEWAAGNTDRPEIAAGSVIEIDGSPFYYATDETIVDEAGLTDGWCYIKHVVSGDAVTPTLTNTFGIWDTAKQGFYDGGDRYSLHVMYRSGAITKIFTQKGFVSNNGILLQTPLTTDVNAQGHIEYTSDYYAGEKIKYKVFRTTIASGSTSGNITHGISNADINRRILDIRCAYVSSGSVSSLGEGAFAYNPTYFLWTGTTLFYHIANAPITTETYQILVAYI